MDNNEDIKNNLISLFKILNIEPNFNNDRNNLTISEIKLQIENILKLLKQKKINFEKKLNNMKEYITKDEYNTFFINYLKSKDLVKVTNQLKLRKSYHEYYLKKDKNNQTEFEKIIDSLDEKIIKKIIR